MWQTGGGQAVHSLWWPSLTKDMQTETERVGSASTSSCIMLETNSSNDEKKVKTVEQAAAALKAITHYHFKSKLVI